MATVFKKFGCRSDGPLLVPESCSAMFGLEAGALDRGGGRAREPELVCEPKLFICIRKGST